MLTTALREAVARAAAKNAFPLPGTDGPEAARVPLEVPRIAAHGDYATNLALVLAKVVGRPPRQVAEALVSALDLGPDTLEETTIS